MSFGHAVNDPSYWKTAHVRGGQVLFTQFEQFGKIRKPGQAVPSFVNDARKSGTGAGPFRTSHEKGYTESPPSRVPLPYGAHAVSIASINRRQGQGQGQGRAAANRRYVPYDKIHVNAVSSAPTMPIPIPAGDALHKDLTRGFDHLDSDGGTVSGSAGSVPISTRNPAQFADREALKKQASSLISSFDSTMGAAVSPLFVTNVRNSETHTPTNDATRVQQVTDWRDTMWHGLGPGSSLPQNTDEAEYQKIQYDRVNRHAYNAGWTRKLNPY